MDEGDLLLVPGASSNRLTGRRVLMTGAAGFIGTALCRRLLQASAEVHGTWRTRSPEPGSGVLWSRVDLCDSDAASGRRRVDWIYVDDRRWNAGRAQSDLVPGVTIDLGTGTRSSGADVAHTIADIVGSGPAVILGAIPDRTLEAEPVADVDRTRRVTGWTPSVPLRTGLERTVEWCRSQMLSRQVLDDA